jgi:hypothetical protein
MIDRYVCTRLLRLRLQKVLVVLLVIVVLNDSRTLQLMRIVVYQTSFLTPNRSRCAQ